MGVNERYDSLPGNCSFQVYYGAAEGGLIDTELNEVLMDWINPVDGEHMYVDAIKVTAIQEPGSLSMLAVSAAAITLLRRKFHRETRGHMTINWRAGPAGRPARPATAADRHN
jgi:hypothetical protein